MLTRRSTSPRCGDKSAGLVICSTIGSMRVRGAKRTRDAAASDTFGWPTHPSWNRIDRFRFDISTRSASINTRLPIPQTDQIIGDPGSKAADADERDAGSAKPLEIIEPANRVRLEFREEVQQSVEPLHIARVERMRDVQPFAEPCLHEGANPPAGGKPCFGAKYRRNLGADIVRTAARSQSLHKGVLPRAEGLQLRPTPTEAEEKAAAGGQ